MDDLQLALPEEMTKRIVADAIKKAGMVEVNLEYKGDVRYSRYDALAEMIWTGVVEGIIYFSDGTNIVIPGLKDAPRIWLDMVKFLAGHLDGGVGVTNNATNQVNVFKVYSGIDVDRV